MAIVIGKLIKHTRPYSSESLLELAKKFYHKKSGTKMNSTYCDLIKHNSYV